MELSLEAYEESKAVSEKRDMAMVDVESERAVQEVQAALVIAKRFPRDLQKSFNRIMGACERKNLAENAEYSYPRGGTSVTGPSIRLAEVLAQNWGNMDFGIKELNQSGKASEVMAYAWDLETNTKQVKVFTVPHTRYSRAKGVQMLTDPRDIYEMTANQGARRLRACILGIIPGDIVDEAIKACRKTVKTANAKLPLKDRIRNLMLAFDKIGVTPDLIERRLGHGVSLVTEDEYIDLVNIGVSLRDNMTKREDWFVMGASASGLTAKLDGTDKPPITGAEFLLLIKGMRSQLEGYVMANIDSVSGYDPKVKEEIAKRWLNNKGFNTPLPDCLAEFGPQEAVVEEEDDIVDANESTFAEDDLEGVKASVEGILNESEGMSLEAFKGETAVLAMSIGFDKIQEILLYTSNSYEEGETNSEDGIHPEDYESVILMANQQKTVVEKQKMAAEANAVTGDSDGDN